MSETNTVPFVCALVALENLKRNKTSLLGWSRSLLTHESLVCVPIKNVCVFVLFVCDVRRDHWHNLHVNISFIIDVSYVIFVFDVKNTNFSLTIRTSRLRSINKDSYQIAKSTNQSHDQNP